jgi:hypothetical protein
MSGSSLRDRYTQPANEPEEIDEVEENDNPDPEHYVAFGKARGGRRGEIGIKLYYDDGATIEVMYYANLMRVLSISPDILLLMTTDYVYTILGNDLRPLLSLLREHKITFLQAFNSQVHPPLAADNSETVINAIYSATHQEYDQNLASRKAIRS